MKVGEHYVTDHEPLHRESLWSELDVSHPNGSSSSPGHVDLKNLHYSPYVMPSNSLYHYFCFVPHSIYHSLHHMSKIFGWGFIFSVLLVYGFQQGLGNSWFFQARDYYFKDIAKVEPADAQIFIAISMTPWNLKPIYGMLSDSIPIYGYHRIPYIIIAGVLGCLCFTILSSIPLSPMMVVILLVGVNLSVASPDVMVDGLVAERTREYPIFATDLQSLCWGCMSLFAISGYLTSGFMITTYGSIVMFRLLIISSIVIIITGSMNWFGDVNKNATKLVGRTEFQSVYNSSNSGANTTCFCGLITIDKTFLENHTSLFFIGTFIPFLAILISTLILLVPSWYGRLIIVLSIWSVVIVSFYSTAYYSGLPDVANAGLFIFLSNSITPDIETAMFYWYTNAPEGPQFTPQFVGYISGIAFGAMFIGILIYNRYLSSWKYRTIFAATMFFLALMGLIDIVLVKRWNLSIGIPDEILILGDSALSPMARRFYVMPLFILAAKVCPQGAEATVFSLLTALGNFGSSISAYSGSLVLSYFDVSDGNYHHLVTVILIKCCCRLIPILLIPFLIPNGSPYSSSSSSSSSSSDKEAGSDESSVMSHNTENGSVKNVILQSGVDKSLSMERGRPEVQQTTTNGLFDSLQEKIVHRSRSRKGYVGVELDSSSHSQMSEPSLSTRSGNSTSSSVPLQNKTSVGKQSTSLMDVSDDDDDNNDNGIILPFFRSPYDSSNDRRQRHIDQLKIPTLQMTNKSQEEK